jgi:DNA-directed RNA polymerase specialized sigma24 family protein
MTDGECDELTRRAIRGDGDALGELLMAFRGPVENVVFRFLIQRDRLDYLPDLVQDVFVETIECFPRFDPAYGNIYPLMRRISETTCWEWARKNQVLLAECPLERTVEDDSGDTKTMNTAEPALVTAWATDTEAEHGRPPLQTAKGDPARRPPVTRRRGRPVQPKVAKVRKKRPRAPVPEEVLHRRAAFCAGASVSECRLK